MKFFTAIIFIACIGLMVYGFETERRQNQTIGELKATIKTLRTVTLIDSLQFHYIATKVNLAECGFYLIEKSTPKRDFLMKSRLTRLLNAYEYQDSLTMAMLNKIMED